jgi:hypothetical protein
MKYSNGAVVGDFLDKVLDNAVDYLMDHNYANPQAVKNHVRSVI